MPWKRRPTSRFRGLDKDGIAEFLLRFVHNGIGIPRKGRLGNELPRRLPDAGVVRDQLCDGLIHAGRGRRHMRADIGQPCDLQKALHRAVLAVFAVEHREYHIDALAHNAVVFKAQKALSVHRRKRRAAVALKILPCSGRQHAVIVACEQDPVALLGDADRKNMIFAVVDVVEHRFRRAQ